jgi:hypothetical protein
MRRLRSEEVVAVITVAVQNLASGPTKVPQPCNQPAHLCSFGTLQDYGWYGSTILRSSFTGGVLLSLTRREGLVLRRAST